MKKWILVQIIYINFFNLLVLNNSTILSDNINDISNIPLKELNYNKVTIKGVKIGDKKSDVIKRLGKGKGETDNLGLLIYPDLIVGFKDERVVRISVDKNYLSSITLWKGIVDDRKLFEDENFIFNLFGGHFKITVEETELSKIHIERWIITFPEKGMKIEGTKDGDKFIFKFLTFTKEDIFEKR